MAEEVDVSPYGTIYAGPLMHADCGGSWVYVDDTATCDKCGHVQDVVRVAGMPIVSAVVFVPQGWHVAE